MDIIKLTAAELETHIADFADLLVNTVVADGAVGFVMPFDADDATGFWRESILPQVEANERFLFGAKINGHIVGTVQLIVAMPANQPHRVEVAKLMVHPEHRKKGIARKLMAILHETAQQMGKTIITLDTRTGEAAEPLYTSLGYQTAGIIPNYAKNAVGEEFHSTTYMYKEIWKR